MPPTAAAKRAAKPRKPRSSGKPRGNGLLRFWPLVLCLVITPFAVRGASILALEGPKPFALLYPWVEVLRSPVLHLSADTLSTAAQWMLYLQFPLYGLLMTLACRADKHLRAIVTGIVAHFGGLMLAIGLAYFAQ